MLNTHGIFYVTGPPIKNSKHVRHQVKKRGGGEVGRVKAEDTTLPNRGNWRRKGEKRCWRETEDKEMITTICLSLYETENFED